MRCGICDVGWGNASECFCWNCGVLGELAYVKLHRFLQRNWSSGGIQMPYLLMVRPDMTDEQRAEVGRALASLMAPG